jgi:hypothetical protein
MVLKLPSKKKTMPRICDEVRNSFILKMCEGPTYPSLIALKPMAACGIQFESPSSLLECTLYKRPN